MVPVDISPSRLKNVVIVPNRLSLIVRNFMGRCPDHLCANLINWVLPAQEKRGLICLEAGCFVYDIHQGLYLGNAVLHQVLAARRQLQDLLFNLSWI